MAELANIATAARVLAERAVEAARTLTRNGEAADDHQVVVERVAYAATEARVIAELVEVPAGLGAAGRSSQPATSRRACATGSSRSRRRSASPSRATTMRSRAAIAQATAPDPVSAVGGDAIASGGRLAWPLDEILDEVRANVRAFAEREVAPHAERIHHHDELVPERFISRDGEARLLRPRRSRRSTAATSSATSR